MQRRYFWALIVLIPLAVLIAAVAFLQRPTMVVERALDQLGKAETARYTALLTLENAQATQQVLGEQGAVEVTLDGVFARAADTPDTLQADVAFLTKTESVTVNVAGEVRFIGDRVYALVESAPPMFAALAQLKGQWLELPRGTKGDTAAHEVPDELFTDVRRTGVKELNGEQVVTYHAEAKEEGIITMMDGIAELLGTRLTNDQIADLRSSVERVERVPVELAIRRWSRDLRELSTVLTMPGGNTVRFTLTIHETNQPVQVTPPENAASLESLLQPR